jgi:ketosteroid isomerase-like protein
MSEGVVGVIERFNEAFNRQDIDEVMALMTEDCVFERTSPMPDGERYEGQLAVRGYWENYFPMWPGARLDAEEFIEVGDRCIVRWVFRWPANEGGTDHVRGVDVFRVRDGKVAEKLAYVKSGGYDTRSSSNQG